MYKKPYIMFNFLLIVCTSLINTSLFKTLVLQNYDEIKTKFNADFATKDKNVIFQGGYTTMKRKIFAHIAILQNYIKNTLKKKENFDINKKVCAHQKNDCCTENSSFLFQVEFIRSICNIFYHGCDNDNFISLPLCTFFEVFIKNYENITKKMCKRDIDIENCLLLNNSEDKNGWKDLIENNIVEFVIKFANLKTNINIKELQLDINYDDLGILRNTADKQAIYAKVLNCCKTIKETEKDNKENTMIDNKHINKKNVMQKIVDKHKKLRAKKIKKTYTCKRRNKSEKTKTNKLRCNKKTNVKIKKLIIETCCMCLELTEKRESSFVHFLLDTVITYVNLSNIYCDSDYVQLQLLRVAEINYMIYGTFIKQIIMKGNVIFAFVNAAIIEIHGITMQPRLPIKCLLNFKVAYFSFIRSKLKHRHAKMLKDEIFYDLYFPIYYMIFSKCTCVPDNGKRYDSSKMLNSMKILKSKYSKIIGVLLRNNKYRIRANKYANVKQFFLENKSRHNLLDLWYRQLFEDKVALEHNFEINYGKKTYNQFSYKKNVQSESCEIQ